jgi:hypothetical protein
MQGSYYVCVRGDLSGIYCVYDIKNFFHWLAAYIQWQFCLAAMLIMHSVINESTG